MIEALSQHQVINILKTEYVGRIGCSDKDQPYVVPVTFYFDEDSNSIISHTGEGLKLQMLRNNPQACFQLDRIRAINDWESILVWGKFEELKGPDARNGLHNLVLRIRELSEGSSQHIEFLPEMSHSHIQEGKQIVYRIRLTGFSGRLQRPE